MNFRDDIDSLLLKLVTGENIVIKQEELKALKQILRKSGVNSTFLISYTYDKVTEYLEVYNSLTRFLSVVVINELFTSFPDFRFHFLLNYDLRHFFDLTILGSEKPSSRKSKKKKEPKDNGRRKRTKKPRPLMLPPPVVFIQNLRNKSLECFELWYRQYGLESQVLRVGYQYLKNKHGIEFPSEKKSREGIKMKRKFERIKVEIGEYKESIEKVLVQIDSCLKMVIPESLESTDDFDEDEDDDESEEEDEWLTLDDEDGINVEEKGKGKEEEEEEEMEMDNVISNFGLVNKDYQLSVEIDRKELKNHKRKCDPIFEEKIKEFLKELRKRYYPMVQEWGTTLESIRVGKFKREELEFQRILGYVTNVQLRISQVFNQVEEIGIKVEENGEREKNVFTVNTRKRKRNENDPCFESKKDRKKRKI